MEHSQYVTALKKALKAKGIAYAELAQKLKMTESGVKKMLNAKDISFRRILKICECLEILPGQLFALTEKSSIPLLILTSKQQDALIKDRHLLALYWLMTIEKKSVEQIELILNTKKSFLNPKLQKLVSLDLLTERKKVFYPKHLGKFRWPDDSKLAQVLNHEWSYLTLQKALKNKSADDGLHRFSALKLTPKSFAEFLRHANELITEMAQTSEREELTQPERELSDFTFLVSAAKGSVFDSLNLASEKPRG